jgi:uncharacterized protein
MSRAWDDMKKTKEEEYFQKLEREKLAAMSAKKREGSSGDSAPSGMRCPKCGGALEAADFQGVEIDRCKACGGVWLDAGEMERGAGRE